MSAIRGRSLIIEENFEHKANRDKRARALKSLGYEVRRSSARNQTMAPSYLKDCTSEAGRTFFAVVYIVRGEKPTKLFGYE